MYFASTITSLPCRRTLMSWIVRGVPASWAMTENFYWILTGGYIPAKLACSLSASFTLLPA